LDGTGAAVVVYNAPEAQTITLTVEAVDEIDPVVEILELDGAHRLAYNDDLSPETMHAGLIALPLSEAGEYTIRINSFNGATEGNVEVTLTVIDEEESGELIEAELFPNSTVRYTLPRGETYTVTAFDPQGVLDAVLTVRNANGIVIATNDDHLSSDLTLNVFDARLSVTVPDDETYTVEVRDFLGRAGTITVQIEPQ
jgi:hypothetical protein